MTPLKQGILASSHAADHAAGTSEGRHDRIHSNYYGFMELHVKWFLVSEAVGDRTFHLFHASNRETGAREAKLQLDR
jgi:hypothetical protein